MPLIAHHIAAKRTASWQCARQGLKAMYCSRDRREGFRHGISKLENVPRVLRVPHVPPANGNARSRTPATTKSFALTATCKARTESQVLLTIGASNKLAPILTKNRIDN